MKYLITAFLLTSLIVACIKPNPNDPNAVTNPPSQLSDTEGITVSTTVIDTLTGRPVLAEKPICALSTAISETPKKIVDPVPPVQTPPDPKTGQEQRVVNVLSTDVWMVWSLVRIKKQAETRLNQGAWFKFHADGTYEYGYWDEPISTGTWFFDGPKGQLNMDSKLLGDDRQWKLQIGHSEEVMVWVGTERFATTDISLKLERFVNIPKTRAELGVEE